VTYADTLSYGIAFAVAVAVTFVTTPLVRRMAIRVGAVVGPEERRVHTVPTPTLGGVAMFIAFLVAMVVASRLSGFANVFRGSSEPLAVALGATVIFAVGLLDDVREVSAPAKVAGIEYDPGRSARIALLHYRDGEKRYIIAPLGLKPGDILMSGPQADILPGNALPMRAIPTGTTVHNVELTPGRGGQMGRSAGTAIQLVAKEGKYATLRLPSGEMRIVPLECRATVGTIGNADHQNVKVGKAGRKRHMGVRPQTRGTAMNPVDHPHGGGEGSTTPGRHPVTPWGVPTLGYRTRKKNKSSDRYIVRGRRRGKKR